MRLAGIRDDDLKRSCRWTGPLDDDRRGPTLQGEVHELMAVMPVAPQGDEDLTRIEPAAVGRAARDDQVSTADEPGLGQESA